VFGWVFRTIPVLERHLLGETSLDNKCNEHGTTGAAALVETLDSRDAQVQELGQLI
jgi:hypothetical protein